MNFKLQVLNQVAIRAADMMKSMPWQPDVFGLEHHDLSQWQPDPEILFESSSIEANDKGSIVRGLLRFYEAPKQSTIPTQGSRQNRDYSCGFKSRCILDRSRYPLAREFNHTDKNYLAGNTVEIQSDFWTG